MSKVWFLHDCFIMKSFFFSPSNWVFMNGILMYSCSSEFCFLDGLYCMLILSWDTSFGCSLKASWILTHFSGISNIWRDVLEAGIPELSQAHFSDGLPGKRGIAILREWRGGLELLFPSLAADSLFGVCFFPSHNSSSWEAGGQGNASEGYFLRRD